MKKRILSLLLAAVMIISLLPVSALADVSQSEDKCGFNLTWSLEDGVLTISGEGDMFDYQLGNFAPWNFSVGSITSVVLPEGLTSIGNSAFLGCVKLTSIDIPDGVTRIGSSAFLSCSNLSSIKIPDSVKMIGKSAFLGCMNLSDVYFAGSRTKWETIIISSTGNDPLKRANMHFGKDSLEITSQPVSVTADEDDYASFSIAASSSDVDYQWQYKTPGSISWKDCTEESADTAELRIKAMAECNGRQYRCVISDSAGNIVTSSPAALTVKLFKINSQPVSVTAEVGQEVSFSVEAEGSGLTYQWQYKKASETTWNNSSSTGAKTKSITVKATEARNGQQYRCVVKNANGKTLTSETATLKVRILAITSQPESVTVDVGEEVTFGVEAEGSGLTYQWQYKKANETTWQNSSTTGAKTAELTVQATAARNGQQYRCVVKDANGKSVTSASATLAIKALEIISQPESVTVDVGEKVNFSVEAKGSGLTYQWQYKKANETTWQNSSTTGAKTAELTVQATAARNGQQYRCVVKDAIGNKATTEAVTLAIKGPEITSQPENVKTDAGQNVSFKVTATGSGLTYQWQYKKANETTWNNSSSTGAKTAELTIQATDARNGQQYRCVVKDAVGNKITSEPATLTIRALEIISQPESAASKAGGNIVFRVTAVGSGLSYQWQYKTPIGSWNKSSSDGANTDELTVEATNSRNGWQYRCTVTDAKGNSVTSDAATVTIIPDLEIIDQPGGVTAEVGQEVSFKVTAAGSGLTYQWENKLPIASNWSKCIATGADTAELTVTATELRDGQQFRCVITDDSGDTVTSNAATLTIGTPLMITEQPKSVASETGKKIVFKVAATGSGLTYQWQYKTPTANGWSKSTSDGADTAELTVKATKGRDGWQYRCVVTDDNGSSVISDPATITIGDVFEISGQPESATAKVGENVIFSVTATGNGLTYQWQYKTPTASGWSKSSSAEAKTANMTVQAVDYRNGYQYRCIVTDAKGNILTSEAATLTVAAAFKITSQPQNVTGQTGKYVTFSVEAEGDGLTYQWQYKTSGSSSWNKSSSADAKTANLSVQAVDYRNGYQYRCVITDADGNKVTSDAATLTVSVLTITEQPVSESANAGNTVTFSVAAKGSGLTYQWQYKTRTGSSWNKSSSEEAKTANMTVQAVDYRDGYQYRCVITDANGSKVISEAATLTVIK